MDVSKEPRMFLLLTLLVLGPGKRTTAVSKPPDVTCIVFNDDYMTCEWDSSQKPAYNYSLFYRYWKNSFAECGHYLQRDGVNTGCWFNRSQIDLYHSFDVYVNISNNDSSPFSERMDLLNRVKPNPPVNLTAQSSGNNQLLVTWASTYRKPHCLMYKVEYSSSTGTKSKSPETEEMKYILPSVDPQKCYTFYVRSKINNNCGTTELWSLPAGPVIWEGNSTCKGPAEAVKPVWFWIQNVLFPVGSLLFLILLFLTLMCVERVRLVLVPRIPNPSNKFEELFTAYKGNFSEWAGVPKDAVESFKPSYHESICYVTELLPGGGYLPLCNDILGKAGDLPVEPVEPRSTLNRALEDNQQFLANINCSFLLLMHYIRDKAGLEKTEPIDLCEENGTLKLLFLVKFPEESASKFLTPRSTYYICRVERGASGTKNENSYRAFHPVFKHPPMDLIDSLRNQCDFLERSRVKMLRSQDGKKPPTMEALLSSMAGQVAAQGKSTGKAGASAAGSVDEEGLPRKVTGALKTRIEASRKDKHR